MNNPGPIRQTTKEALACKLTSPQLQERKRTVLANLKKLVLEKSDVANGFKFRFKGTDEVLDELTAFVKTERMCCPFFEFSITVSPESEGNVWLTISGPEGAREFIQGELGL